LTNTDPDQAIPGTAAAADTGTSLDRLSVIIPAHNEEGSISHLLTALTAGEGGSELDIVVVCNGCTDNTADVARRHGPGVRVDEVAAASKALSLRRGDELARGFPRVYVDADVVIDRTSVLALADALADGPVLACGPRRVVELEKAGLLVRWYYDVWQRLPQVEQGLFGRGVVMVSAEGYERLRRLPQVMSDDLAMSEAFSATERRVVTDAVVVIRPPRTVRDLVRRRVRVVTGNAQVDDYGLRHNESRTSARGLLEMASHSPRLAVRLPVFLSITLLARVLSRRAVRARDFSTWQRDDSSRA
jgi:glycosyltransferase involved in cell wall biosynthesis